MEKSDSSGKRGQAYLFHFCHEFLRKSLESRKWWKKVGLADFFHTSGLENVARPTFSTFFHELLRKCLESQQWWKQLAWPAFPTLRARKTRPGLHFQLFHKFLTVLRITKMVEKSWPGTFSWQAFSTLQAWKTWPGLLFPLFSQISDKVLRITKMVEKSWPGTFS